MSKALRLLYHNASNIDQQDAQIGTLPDQVQAIFKKQGIFGLGESYVAGLWNKSELDTFMYQVFKVSDSLPMKRPWILMLSLILRNYLYNPHSKQLAYNIAKKHYDLGNDLFTAMLDGTMTYTCGFWENAHNLEQAQSAKLELICQKLDLRAGMHILDIGCGWGNFAKYASSKYGVHVTGVTVSKEQASYAKKSCASLAVEILTCDYREVRGEFDHVVSIEMIEAVGKRNIPEFFDKIHRSLKPKGRALIQAISAETFSKLSNPAVDQFTLWIMKHIFPDGYLPNLQELTQPARKKFNLEDIQSFGEHYDPTLKAWARNFEMNWSLLEPHYGEVFMRTWKFYLESCAALFRAKKAHVYQLLYSKAD